MKEYYQSMIKNILLCLLVVTIFTSKIGQVEAPTKEIVLTPNQVLGISMAIAIKEKETLGNYYAKGKSGEIGAYQYMPKTYIALTKKYYGSTTIEATPEVQDTLAQKELTSLFDKGYSIYQVALIWNQGHPGKCSKGINKYGAKFNSCDYAESIVKKMNKLI